MGDEITPTNTIERTYAIIISCFAYVMAATSVSSITTSMTRLNVLDSPRLQKLCVLRNYLTQNNISNRLAVRVNRNAQHALRENQLFMPEKNVELLALISGPLRVEIHFELYSRILDVHPFFLNFIRDCPQVAKAITHTAV